MEIMRCASLLTKLGLSSLIAGILGAWVTQAAGANRTLHYRDLQKRMADFKPKMAQNASWDLPVFDMAFMASKVLPMKYQEESINELVDRVKTLENEHLGHNTGSRKKVIKFTGYFGAAFELLLRKAELENEKQFDFLLKQRTDYSQSTGYRYIAGNSRRQAIDLHRQGQKFLYGTSARRFGKQLVHVERTMNYIRVILGQHSEVDAYYTGMMEKGKKLPAHDAIFYAHSLAQLNKVGLSVKYFGLGAKSTNPRFFVAGLLSANASVKRKRWSEFEATVLKLAKKTENVDPDLSLYLFDLVKEHAGKLRKPATIYHALNAISMEPFYSDLVYTHFVSAKESLKAQAVKAATFSVSEPIEMFVIMDYFDQITVDGKLLNSQYQMFNGFAELIYKKSKELAAAKKSSYYQDFARLVESYVVVMGERLANYPPDGLSEQAIMNLDRFLEKIQAEVSVKEQLVRTLEVRAKLIRLHFQFAKASEVYTKLVAIDWLTRKQKQRYAVQMVDTYRSRISAGMAQFGDFKTTPLPLERDLSAEEETYLNSCELFHKIAPGLKKQRSGCDSDKAKILLMAGKVTEAISQLWYVASSYPGAANSLESVEIVNSLLADDPGQLESGLSKLLQIPVYQVGAIGRILKSSRRLALYKKIGQEEDPLERARRLYLFARKESGYKIGQEALLEAAEAFASVGRLANATEAFKVYLREYPRSVNSLAVMLKLGRLYGNLFDFGQSVYYLDAFARRTEDQELKTKVAVEACEYSVVYDLGKAVRVCQGKEFDSVAGKNAQVYLISWLGRLNRAQLLSSYVTDVFLKRKDLTPDDVVLANSASFSANLGTGPYAEKARTALYNVFLESKDQLSGESRKRVASLATEGLGTSVEKFSRIYLTATNVDDYIGALQNKKQALAEIESNFSKVMATKDPYFGALALSKLFESSSSFAVELENAPFLENVNRKEVSEKLKSYANSMASKASGYIIGAVSSIRKFDIATSRNREIINQYYRTKKSSIVFEDIVPSNELVYK